MTPDQKKAFEVSKAMVERMAMKLVSMDAKTRHEQYEIVKRNLEDVVRNSKAPSEWGKKWIELQMEGLKALVNEIEASGGGKGGHA